MIKLDKHIFTTYESVLSFYLSKGGNGLPHFMHMDKSRMMDIFQFLKDQLKSDLSKSKINEAIKDIKSN